MLRVTICETPHEQQFVLEGKLTQPWIAELESAWERSRTERQGRRCVIDLSGTTAIDPCGKQVLARMSSEGAQFIAKGIATMHLVEDIQRACVQHTGNAAPGRHCGRPDGPSTCKAHEK